MVENLKWKYQIWGENRKPEVKIEKLRWKCSCSLDQGKIWIQANLTFADRHTDRLTDLKQYASYHLILEHKNDNALGT